MKDNHGVYVQNVVKNAAGDKAGIKEGDIIKKIDNKEVNTGSEVSEIMTQLSPNEVIEFEIERNGQILVKSVKLDDQKHTEDLATKQLGKEIEVLGAKIREITDKEKQDYQLSRGLVINKIGKGVLASQGLKDGFVITAIDTNPNITLKDANELNSRKGQVVIEGFYPNTGRSYYLVLVL